MSAPILSTICSKSLFLRYIFVYGNDCRNSANSMDRVHGSMHPDQTCPTVQMPAPDHHFLVPGAADPESGV